MKDFKTRGEKLKASMIKKFQAQHPGISEREAYDMWIDDMRFRGSKGGSVTGVSKGFAHPNADPRGSGRAGGLEASKRRSLEK